MIEEAAGTRMYEMKRQAAQKHIAKKEEKFRQLHAVSHNCFCKHQFFTVVFVDIYGRNQSEATEAA